MGSDNIHLAFTATLTLMLFASMAIVPAAWSWQTLLVLFVMSFTHFMLYPYIWYYPKHYMKFVAGDRGVEFYRDFVFVQKCSIALLGAYFWFDLDRTLNDTLTLANWPLVSIAVGLALLGAHLNHAVYKQIGANGVYYGFKLGKHVPWVTDYPFDTYRHPQYTGAWSAVAGCTYLLGGNIPEV